MQMQQPDNVISLQEWGRQVASITGESLFAVGQGTGMSFDPHYDPSVEYDRVQLNKHSGAAKRGRGRTRRDAPVDHHLVDEDDVDDPAQFAPKSAAIFDTGDSSNKDPFSSAPVASTSSSPLPSTPIPILWPEDGILTLTWVKDLTLAFDYASRTFSPSQLPSVFPVEALDCLVQRANNLLHEEDNCMHIDASLGLGGPGSRVVVVGDIHGQFHDLLFLLSDAGFPSEHQFFVFNGDYIDRGAWGLETFLLLLAWKVFMPKRVFLLRGNHESKLMTSRFGFQKEVLVKYAAEGKDVYKKCLGCFIELPLASIINGNVYTAHGGLFRSMKKAKGKNNHEKVQRLDVPLSLGSLEELSKATRHVCEPPCVKNLIPADVLWSDPSQKLGLSVNEDRGCGLLWGPDCTDMFLKKSNLKLIIRSLEGPDARMGEMVLEEWMMGTLWIMMLNPGN